MAEEQDNIKQNFNFAQTGLNLDLTPSQIKKGMLSYALNATIESFDASGVNYQNEQGNEFCVSLPEGFVKIGKHFINEKNIHIFFITNPNLTSGNKDEIGYMENNDCIYRTLIKGDFGFSIHYPIHKVEHKIGNCSTEIYWTDALNPRRYLDIEKIPRVLIGGTPACNPIYGEEVDVNQLNIQPDFSIPQINVVDVTNIGTLVSGTYQFAVQYCDVSGHAYTSYYSITNPTPIADSSIVTPNFNSQIGKSIVLDITNLDLTGQFQYFNLAVIKTINAISSVELVGVYFIDGDSKQVIYTGQIASNTTTNIRLSINDILEKFPYYDVAKDLTAVQDVLVWDDLLSIDRINYQHIANKITLKWETWRIPASEDYSNEINATNFRSYLRDEVYPFEIVFLLKNGKQTDGFHIPGRIKGYNELHPDVPNTNPDFIGEPDYYSGDIGYSPYWKIYNTASVTETSSEYKTDVDYKGPYQIGEFAYWESSEEYPCNRDVWGDLAGQKIRHHKFPDVLISPIFESRIFTGVSGMTMEDNAIFPIGIKIDVGQIRTLINSSSLTSAQKNDIVGFKIVRGDRSTNKSVIAKGLLRNVGSYDREGKTFYFPNYPYNDLNKDVFINGMNNAYEDECLSYDVEVTSLSPTLINPDTGNLCAEVTYIDCNTNITITKKYDNVGTFQLCSIGFPIFSAGTGRAGTSSYEVWKSNSGDFLSLGFRIGYYDRYLGYQTYWQRGGWDQSDHTFQVIPETGGLFLVEGPGDLHVSFVEFVQGTPANCGEEKGLPPIKDTPELAYRQIFNSPETSFSKPFLGNVLKLENVLYGKGIGHFVEVKNNAKYRLLSEQAQFDALYSSESLSASADPFDLQILFSAFQAYVQVYSNGITKRNFAYSYNSIANYDYSEEIPNNQGVKQRNLDIKKYLVPSVISTTDDFPINNWHRETSIYLKTDGDVSALPYPDKSPKILTGPNITELSRKTISTAGSCNYPNKETDLTVVSYYASIKNYFINQWGQIYSYNTIDTGYQNTLENTQNDVVFGGDTFINRFAFKTKLPFFLDNRVNAPDESDIFYDEIGNVGFPKYWHSARSILKNFPLTQLSAGGPVQLSPLTNIISYKAHNFDCPNFQGDNETDADRSLPGRTYYDGYFYLFAYGVPNFYCESSVNVDLRQAFNNKEGDFFPHVTNHIPDDWFQENFVSIAQDNTYYYNTTFSKQNKENVFTHIPPDWEDKLCFTLYPFRAIYSDSQNTDADNRVNAWRNYKALSYFDFPQNYGKLTSLDGIQNKAVLARFENKTLLYDNLLTIDTSNPQAAYVGNPYMFKKSPPIDFAETDLGYIGSQHKMLLKIPQGQLTVDAKRGQVFLLNGGANAVDLAGFGSGLNRFFTDHLAFEILRWFPEVDVDNHFNGIGLHGVYDSKFDRLILTKLDYIPIDPNIKYDAETREFYIENITTMTICDCDLFGFAYITEPCDLIGEGHIETGSPNRPISQTTVTTTTSHSCTEHHFVKRIVISLNDPNYFCNKSWTLSYNMNTKTWVSFHSYIPNWYIAENNFFYSGINGCCEDFDFIVGTIVTTTSTTTVRTPDCRLAAIGSVITTSTTTTSAPTTTTTSTTNTTTTTTTICQRPMPLKNYPLIKGYHLTIPETTFVSTGSKVEACAAEEFLLNYNYNEDPGGLSVSLLNSQAASLSLGQMVYRGYESTDCVVVPDGWYFTEEIMYSHMVIHIVSGRIVEISSCISTTTTTSSTSSTTTSTSTTIWVTCNDTITYEDHGDIYETSYIGDLSSDEGLVLFDFAIHIAPKKFIVKWDGNIVIDTGYYGSSSYNFGGSNRAYFKSGLLGKTDPTFGNTYPDFGHYPNDGYPTVTFAYSDSYSFYKSAASPSTAEVYIYSPYTIVDSVISFQLHCPVATTTTTSTTTSTPTTTTTSTIGSTTTTTTTELIVTECRVFLVDEYGDVYSYEPSTGTCTYRLSSGVVGIDIANTYTKLWISHSSNKLDEYDITLSPFTYEYNRTITLPSSAGSGLTVKSADDVTGTYELIAGGYPDNIIKFTITPSGVSETTLFSMGANMYVTGDIIHNSDTNRYIISNYHSVTATSYITEYGGDGSLLSQITISPNDVYGLFTYNNNNYAITSDHNVYLISFSTGLSLVDTIPITSLIYGASQNVTCTSPGIT